MAFWRKRIIVTALLVAPLSSHPMGTIALGGEDQGEILQIPGLPPIRMPPGAHVEGPGNHLLPSRDGLESGRAGDDRATGELNGPGGAGRRSFRDFGAGIAPGNQLGSTGSSAPGFGSTVIGPGGINRPGGRQLKKPKPKVMTPEEKAASIRKVLMPKPPSAVARRQTLDDLYGKLSVAADADEAKGLASLIGTIWMRSESDTANLLMQRAIEAVEHKDYPLALTVLDRVVALRPDWAEGWNKRASVRFFAGDLDGSMSDVERVLKLEPRHFGALEGMAAILKKTGFDKRALEVYRRALAVYPHQPDIEKIVDKLTLRVEGQGI